MSWRIVVVKRNAKLSYKGNYLIIRNEEVQMIHLSEIHTLIIESTAVSITSFLLCELMNQKVKVIFCDEKRNPCCELVSYYGSHDTSRKIKNQTELMKKLLDDFKNKADYVLELEESLGQIQKMIFQELNEYEALLTAKNDLSFQSILKFMKIKPEISRTDSFLEKAFAAIDLLKEIPQLKFSIILGARSYFDEEHFNELIKYINYNKQMVLLIDQINEISIKREGVIQLQVDEFFEEFLIE